MIFPNSQELKENGKISWLDFCDHYIINIWEEQNVVEDPSKEDLAQDFIVYLDSENKTKTRCSKPGSQLSPEQLKGPHGFFEPQRSEINFRMLLGWCHDEVLQ